MSGDLGFSGSSSTGGGRLDVGMRPDSYLQNLQFLLMLQAEASKGNWTILADAAYLDFGHEQTTVNTVGAGNGATVVIPRDVATEAGSSLSGGLFGLAVAYTALHVPWGTIEPLGGLRYLNLSANPNWTLSATFTGQGATLAREGSLTQTANIVDGIVGVRGRIRLGDSGRWYMPYYFDFGTGSSRYTVQASGGAAYAAKWGDPIAGCQLLECLAWNIPSSQSLFRASSPNWRVCCPLASWAIDTPAASFPSASANYHSVSAAGRYRALPPCLATASPARVGAPSNPRAIQ
ncbi:hypothetical protein [Cupriavidus lacunae]|uniref:hypothetical protein n=1 Tax=Cupriavidus lacunae TaxID=2666307 RepID=UPI001ABEF63F|nr:hypothetical protein [Cupriavidus lacunae]